MRARRLQRPNRVEGPFVLAVKHKVSQGYSPADLPIHAKSGREWGPENAGLAHAFSGHQLGNELGIRAALETQLEAQLAIRP